MIEEFRKYYGDLPDAVIRSINFKYPDYKDFNNLRSCCMMIHCKNVLEDYRWEEIELIFENIISFRLFEDKFTNQILNETEYVMMDGMFAIDFSCNSAWQTIEELKNSSDFYLVCKKFKYKVQKLLS